MSLLPLVRSVAALFHRSRAEDDMDVELRSHIQHRADDLERSGIDRARLEFGGYQRFKEECREAVGIAFIDTLAQDLRFSVRVLRKSPDVAVNRGAPGASARRAVARTARRIETKRSTDEVI